MDLDCASFLQNPGLHVALIPWPPVNDEKVLPKGTFMLRHRAYFVGNNWKPPPTFFYITLSL